MPTGSVLDGLSSGAILKAAFERQGYSVRRFSLEKPYPKVLEKVFQQKGELIVLTDFAGRIAPLISDLNQGRNLTLILDHHKAFTWIPNSLASREIETSPHRLPVTCLRALWMPPTRIWHMSPLSEPLGISSMLMAGWSPLIGRWSWRPLIRG